jgi:hypothetical protein
MLLASAPSETRNARLTYMVSTFDSLIVAIASPSSAGVNGVPGKLRLLTERRTRYAPTTPFSLALVAY